MNKSTRNALIGIGTLGFLGGLAAITANANALFVKGVSGGSPTCPYTYKINPGDTLNGICGKFAPGNPWCLYWLQQCNPGINVNALQVGQCVSTPYPVMNTGCSGGGGGGGGGSGCSYSYTVQSGDYCYGIASKCGTTVQQIYNCNPNVNSNCTNLYVGEVLHMPTACGGSGGGGGGGGGGSGGGSIFVNGAPWNWNAYDGSILNWSHYYGLDPWKIKAQISIESSFYANAQTYCCCGLMQVNPLYNGPPSCGLGCSGCCYGCIMQPDANIAAGCKAMRMYLDRYGWNWTVALQAYNCGDGSAYHSTNYPCKILYLAGQGSNMYYAANNGQADRACSWLPGGC